MRRHLFLKKQAEKFLSEEQLQNDSIKLLLSSVNQTYFDFENEIKLSGQVSFLENKSCKGLSKKLRDEIIKNTQIQSKLITSIKELGDYDLNDKENYGLIDLLKILEEEIKIKKKIQEELIEAKVKAEKANEAKSNFLSIMSHEIRTPLNAIIGLIYIMEKENSLESFHENIETLKYSAQNLFLLINDILDYNKIEAGKIKFEQIPFNFAELLKQILKTLESKFIENGNSVEIFIDRDFIPYVVGDPHRLGQILINLISNASKFTQNGKIEVRLMTLNVNSSSIYFKVEIIDNGIGIEENKIDLIFEKFSQADTTTSRKFGGTGLGLIITKKLLNILNSDIEVVSKFGKGSNFFFSLELPLFIDKQKDNDYLNNDLKEIKLKGMKVLLAEDNLINTKIAVKILSGWEVEVDVAENGAIAIEKHTQKKYDAILMDLSMPVMDGFQSTAVIRKEDKRIPILALTASTSYSHIRNAIELGINDFVVKPFNPKELNLKLAKYFTVTD